MGTLQATTKWEDIVKILKEKNFQPRILYPLQLSFKSKGENKYFPDNQKQENSPSPN